MNPNQVFFSIAHLPGAVNRSGENKRKKSPAARVAGDFAGMFTCCGEHPNGTYGTGRDRSPTQTWPYDLENWRNSFSFGINLS